jgi:hypothetical protein
VLRIGQLLGAGILKIRIFTPKNYEGLNGSGQIALLAGSRNCVGSRGHVFPEGFLNRTAKRKYRSEK